MRERASGIRAEQPALLEDNTHGMISIMTTQKWSDIRAKKISPEELRQIDREIESELLEMDLRALREAAGLTQDKLEE
jgi:hypothetical protein